MAGGLLSVTTSVFSKPIKRTPLALSRDLSWPWRGLRLGLRIADGLCQHLAQLSLGFRRFAAWGLPLCHEQ